MKKLFLSAVLALALGGVQAQSIKFSSATPVAGQPLSFEYDAKGGKLDGLANVKCVAQTFVNKKQKVVNIDLTKEGSVYKGSFTPVDSTAIAVLTFAADGTKDDNAKGYYTLFYKDGKPTGMAYYWEAVYYNGMGAALAGIKSDKAKAIAAYENAFKTDPSLKAPNLISYLALQYGVDKANGEKMIMEQIASYNKSSKPTEDELLNVASLYSVLKRKPSADSVYNIVKATFPKGKYVYGKEANAIYNEKDAAKMEEKLKALMVSFNLDPNKKADAEKLEGFYAEVASAYGLAKNNAKFEAYSNKISSKTTLASIYNTYAWAGAEKKENMPFSAKISKKSLELLEAAKNEPVPPYYASKESYLKGIDGNYASYADTYALLLDQMGNSAEALKYQEKAVNMNNFSSPDMNVRFVSFLKKNNRNEDVVKYAERFIKEGQGTEQLKTDLKAAYKGSQPFDAYYGALEKEAIAKERAKFEKEMIKRPAPAFTLMNLKGEKVELASLKGKVVIVDYWATWCGPCVASFPGMQKAVDKYKNDPSVVFLFVNTWQTEENREKVVKDFMASTPYTFNVLYDTKNKQDPSKFDVIDSYNLNGDGIPQKYIIDGNGNIRFKKVGFGGSADGTVKELDMMIELAKGASQNSK
ncbi:redoxin domain-containing protein [Pedobacter sp. KR3-3]|uniref:Redoxin domain-containing protein n=1 Tax=Pedobacter albus TaxID=3113905 RepID=A0ABU7I876_9SPHI|nr:redoxin domain-containing protein [Pedobacter sp. KR3-3]MEE1945506.1 redoxin domain-containing protein [Pedobacter sp. KR3-3]